MCLIKLLRIYISLSMVIVIGHWPMHCSGQCSMVMVTFLLLNDSHKEGNNGEDFKPSSEFSKLFSTGFFPSGRLHMKSSLSQKIALPLYINMYISFRDYLIQMTYDGIFSRFSWFESFFGRIWWWQRTTGGRRRKENLPLLLPAAVLARPLQAHQRHAQVCCSSDWTEKVLQV